MDNKNINKNTTNNVIARPSPAAASQRAASSAIQAGNRASAIAADLQNAPQVGDPHYTRLMRLLALSQPLTGQEYVDLVSKIANKDLQKAAYAKIVNSLQSKPEELSIFKQQVQDPAVLEEQEAITRAKIEQQQAIATANDSSLSIAERYAAAQRIKDIEEQAKAFCCIFIDNLGRYSLEAIKAVLKQLNENAYHPHLIQELITESLDQDQFNPKGLYHLDENLNDFIELIRLTCNSGNDSDLKNQLLTKYFQIYTQRTHDTTRKPQYLGGLTTLIEGIVGSANGEDQATIVLKVANSLYGDLQGWKAYEALLGAIYQHAPRWLQKEFAYSLLKKLMRVIELFDEMNFRNWDLWRGVCPYRYALELFLPVSSVYDEDVDELIANVLSQAPHLDDQCYLTLDGRNTFWETVGQGQYRSMCTAVLELYMPSEQISAEKKNLMIQVIACNENFSKSFRKQVITKYIQDENLREELLAIVDLDLTDARFKKMKVAARPDEQS